MSAFDAYPRAQTPAGTLAHVEISAHGPIGFARFMEIALYGPAVGYYETRAARDFNADYVTSPQLHPAFGVLLCGQVEEMWRRLGRPSVFWFVEAGPGTGIFAADVLATAEEAYPEFSRALRVGLVERSLGLVEIQKTTLARWSDRVRWIGSATEAQLGPGCLFANELFDAFPVHRVIQRAGELRELYIAVAGEGFIEIENEPATSALGAQIAAGGGCLRDGDVGEVNLDGPAWLTTTVGLIERGYVLILDYGEPATLLYGERHPRGTLRCYWQHTMNEEPLQRVGLQDMTAHVDLSALVRAGEAAGLTLGGATNQQRLLSRLGLGELRQRLRREVGALAERRGHEAALNLLTGSSHLGRVAALVFAKGVAAGQLTGFQEHANLLAPSTRRIWEPRIADLAGLVASLGRSRA